MVKKVKMQSRCGTEGFIFGCDRCKKSPLILCDADGRDVCYDCLLKLFDTKVETCSCCNEETLCYDVDGEWFCDECIKEQFPSMSFRKLMERG